jgi:hypothetical protein
MHVNGWAQGWKTEPKVAYMIKSVSTKLAENMKEPKDANPKCQYENLNPARVHHGTDENDFEQDKIEHVVVQMLSAGNLQKINREPQ